MLFREISKTEFTKAYKTERATRVNRAEFIQKFIDSGIPYAEIDWKGEYKSAATAAHSLKDGARLIGANHIKVFSRGIKNGNEGKVYIVNTLLADKEDA